MHRNRLLSSCAATLLILLSYRVLAADASLQGAWKIAVPHSALETTDGSSIPFTDKGRKLYEANRVALAKGDYEAYDMTMARCASPGPPRLMLTPNRFKIFVRDDVISIMFEWNRLLRQIDMRGQASDPDWGNVAGRSWGHWEGRVLVVDSRGFSRKRLLDNLLPNSDDLKLMERIRLKDRNTLEDRITINDPEIFTRPWDTTISYKRQPDEVFPEDVCIKRKELGQLPLPAG